LINRVAKLENESKKKMKEEVVMERTT